MNTECLHQQPADYRLRVVAFYRARASESLDRARAALETGQLVIGRFHLDEAQAWAQFACTWARRTLTDDPSDLPNSGVSTRGQIKEAPLS